MGGPQSPQWNISTVILLIALSGSERMAGPRCSAADTLRTSPQLLDGSGDAPQKVSQRAARTSHARAPRTAHSHKVAGYCTHVVRLCLSLRLLRKPHINPLVCRTSRMRTSALCMLLAVLGLLLLCGSTLAQGEKITHLLTCPRMGDACHDHASMPTTRCMGARSVAVLRNWALHLLSTQRLAKPCGTQSHSDECVPKFIVEIMLLRLGRVQVLAVMGLACRSLAAGACC